MLLLMLAVVYLKILHVSDQSICIHSKSINIGYTDFYNKKPNFTQKNKEKTTYKMLTNEIMNIQRYDYNEY